jgi:tRNA/rRNA methyltransferase
MHERARTENITVVLNKPKYPGNIGSAARCVKNMGIERIIVVGEDNYEEDTIRRMSTHLAADVVDGIKYVDDLEKALGTFRYIVGMTARYGNTNLKRTMVSPREMARQIVDVSRNNKVAILFGPEDRGLTNSELKYCDMLVRIPTSEKMSSINLSHAVMLICYEIFTAGRESGVVFTPRLATSEETENMYSHMEELLLRINFIDPGNPENSMVNIRRFFSRLKLTSKDVKIIRGVFHQIDLYGRGKTKDLTLDT